METDRGVKSILRAFDILNILSDRPKGISLADLSLAMRVPKSSLHRMLAALVEIQVVRKDEARELYFLGYGLLRYSQALLTNIDLVRDARPILEELAQQVDETIHLGILDCDEPRIIYIDKLESSNVVRLVSRIGQSVPLHCTSLGKAVLSSLKEDALLVLIDKCSLKRFTPNTVTDKQELLRHLALIRLNGYAVDMKEHESNVICVAAPIKNQEGDPIAAISISVPDNRIRVEDIPVLGKKVVLAANRISQIMFLYTNN